MDEKPVVLVVDDNKDFRFLVRVQSKELGNEFKTASNFATALRIIHENENRYIMAFIDVNLHEPGKNGLELVRYIIEMVPHRVVPYMWTNVHEDDIRPQALEAGAHFVFSKTRDKVKVIKDYAEKSRILELVKSSSNDFMTGLPNFATFTNRALGDLKMARDREHPPPSESFALLLIDVDRFKYINDHYEYLVGDAVLKAIAKILEENKRPADHVCRKGGDEFLIWLPDARSKEANDVGWKLMQEVSAASVTDSSGRKVKFSISFGIGELDRKEIDDPEVAFETIISRADVGRGGLKERRSVTRDNRLVGAE